MNLYDVNWLAVILAALSGFVVGGIWYGPVMGKRWMKEAGISEADVRSSNMPLIYGATFLLAMVSSMFLAHMFARASNPAFHVIMMMSVGIAIGFIIPAVATNYLFSKRNRALFFIDAGYWLLFYTAMGLVHAFFSAR